MLLRLAIASGEDRNLSDQFGGAGIVQPLRPAIASGEDRNRSWWIVTWSPGATGCARPSRRARIATS
ncbi:hypothetical protein E0H26_13270 [Micromonospora zingiberis]|uniref:Uncharacterized protein n=1 Tax=Micromonospora zingiberis TaxID=2053011 RepID=A0A4V2LWP1_9ACTN|nr:hypothetical protein [Micromonospora zingiberis]TCB97235.1 hypothetical protein E0H26_13270 [Micromonospora zingiberis]